MAHEIMMIMSMQVFLFLVVVVVMAIQNYNLLHNADKRLDRANQMVLKLAASADSLAQSISALKDLCVQVEKNDELCMKEVRANRDALLVAHEGLTRRYELLENRLLGITERNNDMSMQTLRENASRPTINNSNNASV